MENNINRKLLSLVKFTIWFGSLLVFLIAFSSCRTSKKIKRERYEAIQNLERTLIETKLITKQGEIKRVSLKSYQFTDSAGVQVLVPFEKVVETETYQENQFEQAELGESETFEESVSSVDKDVERGTNWVGFGLGVVLILILAFLIKRSTNLLRPFSFL